MKFSYFSKRGEAIEFEVEGGNPAIDQGLRHIANALAGAHSPRAVLPNVPAKIAAFSGATRAAQMTLDQIDDPTSGPTSEPPLEEISGADVSEDQLPTASETRSKQPRKYPTPTFLEDLKMDGFKDFVRAKQPKSNEQKNLVIAYWLKENLKIPSINKDHIYTAYRHMEWRVEADVEQSLRKLKKKNWVGQDDTGFKITHIGEDKVREMARLGN